MSSYSLSIRASPDGRRLEIEKLESEPGGEGPQKWRWYQYDPPSGTLTVTGEGPTPKARRFRSNADILLHVPDSRDWMQSWTRIPATKAGPWAVGTLDSDYHEVVAPPWAVWIASRAQLIRLDRKLRPEWLGSGGE